MLGLVTPIMSLMVPLDRPWPLTDEVLAAAMTLSKGVPDAAGWSLRWTDPAVNERSEALVSLNRPGVAAATATSFCCASRAAAITAGMSAAVSIAQPATGPA